MEHIIYINSMSLTPKEKNLLLEVYKKKQTIELTNLKLTQDELIKKSVQETLEKSLVDENIVKFFETKYPDKSSSLLEKVNSYYEEENKETFLNEQTSIDLKYQTIQNQIKTFGIVANLKKVIIILDDIEIKGFLECQEVYNDDELTIKIDSIYSKGEDTNITKHLLNLLVKQIKEKHVSKKIDIDFNDVITNDNSLNTSKNNYSDISLEALQQKDLELYTLSDIEKNPDLIDNLTKEEIKALTKLVASDEDIKLVDPVKGLAINEEEEIINAKKEGNDYLLEKTIRLENLDSFKVDYSLNDYHEEIVEEEDFTPTLEKKQKQYVKSNIDKRKQGFADALIFTLLTGFCAGILSTICFLVIYLKLN